MFAKLLILITVACTLTIAESVRNNTRHDLAGRQRRGIFGTLGSWLNKATNMVDKLYQGVTYPYRKAFNLLVQTGQGVADFGKEKVQQVLEKYHDIKRLYEKNLDGIKNDIIKRAIGELQSIINILAYEADIKTCNEIKQSNQDIAQSGQEALDKLEHDLEDAVDAELKKLQEDLADWQVEADTVIGEKEKRGKNVVESDTINTFVRV